jgi:hypothetical protein
MRIGVHSRQVGALLESAFGASRLHRHGVQVKRFCELALRSVPAKRPTVMLWTPCRQTPCGSAPGCEIGARDHHAITLSRVQNLSTMSAVKVCARALCSSLLPWRQLASAYVSNQACNHSHFFPPTQTFAASHDHAIQNRNAPLRTEQKESTFEFDDDDAPISKMVQSRETLCASLHVLYRFRTWPLTLALFSLVRRSSTAEKESGIRVRQRG